MKKTLSIVLSLFIILVFTATCMASPGNGKALGKKDTNSQEVTTSQDKANVENQQKDKTEKQETKQVKVQQKIKVKKELKQKFEEEVKDQTKTANQTELKDIGKHWAASSIELLYAAGLISGYPDGTFKPDNCITQAESIILVTKLADEEQVGDNGEEATDEELNDVPKWVQESVKEATKMGFLNINRFHSNIQATRAQTAVWIAKAVGLEPADVSDMPFTDGIQISQEDAGYIVALYQEGIIKGAPGGKFNPNSAITRAEIAAIMERILADKTIESITLPEKATVEQGKSITLKATVNYTDGTSDNDVSWSSSDEDLAKVKDGVVTAADDQTGTVTITATATQGDISKSASCKVTVVKEIDTIDAELKATGNDNIGVHDGKVYQEFKLVADGETIDLDEDNVNTIIMTQDDQDPIVLTPNSDSNLWFNVQRESGSYKFNVEDKDGNFYEATLEWTAPEEVDASLTGNHGEHDGNQYIEYRIGDLDLSDFTKMYQIKPDGSVTELTANSDSNLWFKTSNQQTGDHVFLIYEDGDWYTTEISFSN